MSENKETGDAGLVGSITGLISSSGFGTLLAPFLGIGLPWAVRFSSLCPSWPSKAESAAIASAFGLMIAVVSSLFWRARSRRPMRWGILFWIAAVLLPVSFISTAFLQSRFVVTFEDNEDNPVVIGYDLKEELREWAEEQKLSDKKVLDKSARDPSSVWTPISLALVRTGFLASWIALCASPVPLVAGIAFPKKRRARPLGQPRDA
jgi:hypothetical protein